jgi:ketosteroid isomerase-like protein
MEKNATHPNEDIINKFFEAYSKHDINAIKKVMAENVTWYFLGRHPFAGIKRGVNEVVAFFDQMATIMGTSKPQIEKLIVASNDNHTIECQRIKINRDDGIYIDHHATVLWTFEDGKIIEGRHFFADPQAADKYFTAVAAKQEKKQATV